MAVEGTVHLPDPLLECHKPRMNYTVLCLYPIIGERDPIIPISFNRRTMGGDSDDMVRRVGCPPYWIRGQNRLLYYSYTLKLQKKVQPGERKAFSSRVTFISGKLLASKRMTCEAFLGLCDSLYEQLKSHIVRTNRRKRIASADKVDGLPAKGCSFRPVSV